MSSTCIVTPDLPGPTRNGGVGTHCLYLARFLVRHGQTVTLVHTGTPDDSNGPYWKRTYRGEHGADLKFLHELPPGPDVPVMPHTTRHQTAHRLFQWLRHEAFDTIHFQDWQGNGAVCVQAKRTGIAFADTRLIVTTHGSSDWIREGMGEFPTTGGDSLIDDALERTTVALADLAVSPSRYMLDWLGRHAWRLPQETRVAPYLFDGSSAPARNLAPGKLKEIVFFGRLETRKGIEPFLAAVQQLAVKSSRPLQVTLVGKHHVTQIGPSADLVATVRRQLPPTIDLQVHDDWNHAQAIAYLREREDALVVMPSLADNAPFAVIECLSLGLPILTANRGGIPELVGSAAHLASPTATDLAARLAQAIEQGLPAADTVYSPVAAEKCWREIAEWKPPPENVSISPLKISVCVPHYEQPLQLRATLRVLEQQTQPAHEIIVVDDGSRQPATQSALAELECEYSGKVRFVRQANGGPAAARNAAAQIATGEALVFCDADNHPYPTMLARLGTALRVSGAPIVTCAFRAVRAEGDPQARNYRGYIFCPLDEAGPLALIENVLGDTNFIVKRETFAALTGFNPANRAASEDWEFLLRAAFAGAEMAVVPEPVFDYVIVSHSHARAQSGLAAARAAFGALSDGERTRYERLLLAARGTFDHLAPAHREAETAKLRAQVLALESDLKHTHRVLFKTEQQRELLVRDLEQERRGAKDSAAKLHEALLRSHGAEQRLVRLHASLSWKITSPLRALRRKLHLGATVNRSQIPPRLVYYIEPPASWKGAVPAGIINGWVLNSDLTPVAGVRGYLLGKIAVARYHLPRPDVAQVHGAAALNCGLAFDYVLPPGETHPLVMEALLSDGTWCRFFDQLVTAAWAPSP